MTQRTVLTRGTVLSLCLVAAVAFAAYHDTFMDLFVLWSTSEDYSHGFLVIPVAVYLVWRRRQDILSAAASASGSRTLGWVLCVLWVVLFVVGSVGRIVTVKNLSLVILPIAATAAVLGQAASRFMVVPSFFMVFMFPVPSEIYTRVTNPLLLISTTASFHILNALGIPVLQEGNLLSLPGYTMEVVQACSGIRSLVTITALAYLMAALMLRGFLQSALLLVASVPTAIAGNILRISVTALLAYHVSTGAAEGFSHTLAGIATFIVALAALSLCMILIRWILEPRARLSSQP